MLDKAESVDTYEAEYARKQRKKRRMHIVIFCTCALMSFLCYFLFKPIPWSADDLNVEAVVEDGVVWVYADGAQSGGKTYSRWE